MTRQKKNEFVQSDPGDDQGRGTYTAGARRRPGQSRRRVEKIRQGENQALEPGSPPWTLRPCLHEGAARKLDQASRR